MYRPTKNKENFLTDPSPAIQLSVEDLYSLSQHYFEKAGIKIIVSSTTEYGKQALEKTRQEAETALREKLQGALKVYSKTIFWEQRDKYKEYNQLEPEINHSFLIHFKEQIKSTAALTGLSLQDSLAEMHSIQKNMENHEVYGYLHTGGVQCGPHHVQAYLLTKKEIIQAIWYRYDQTYPSKNNIESAIFYDTDLRYFLRGTVVHPQAGNSECATLGILYLKELLKNNKEQFEQFTLRFPYYDNNGSINYFFFPSPQVLRYAQSSLYIKIIFAMLAHQNTITLKYLTKDKIEKTVHVPTIEKILMDNTRIARESNAPDKVAMYEKFLTELPAFQKKWLAQFAISDPKRSAMNQKNGLNCYLAYRSNKLEKLSSSLRHDSGASKISSEEKNEKVTSAQHGNVRQRIAFFNNHSLNISLIPQENLAKGADSFLSPP